MSAPIQAERGIMARVKRIRIESFLNPNMRHYHVTTHVSAERVHGGFLGGNRHEPFKQSSFARREQEFSEDTKSTIMRFYDIDGVSGVGLDTFSVEIDRSPAYEWEEIEDAIVAVIKEVADWAEDGVQVDYLFVDKLYSEPITLEVYEAERERHEEAERRADRMYSGY